MKISNLFFFAGAALASYHMTKHRDELLQESLETSQLLATSKKNLDAVQLHLKRVQEESLTLKDVTQDLSYRLKIFENGAQTHLHQIQEIWKEK